MGFTTRQLRIGGHKLLIFKDLSATELPYARGLPFRIAPLLPFFHRVINGNYHFNCIYMQLIA